MVEEMKERLASTYDMAIRIAIPPLMAVCAWVLLTSVESQGRLVRLEALKEMRDSQVSSITISLVSISENLQRLNVSDGRGQTTLTNIQTDVTQIKQDMRILQQNRTQP